MSSRFGSMIQSTLLVGSVLVLSACVTTNSAETAKPDVTLTDETTRTVIAAGKFETPPEIQSASMTKMVSAVDTASQPASVGERTPGTTGTRISDKETFVNVRSAPSTKSRVLAVLKAGQKIQIQETRDSWIKISWQQGDANKQGWLKKIFVEGN